MRLDSPLASSLIGPEHKRGEKRYIHTPLSVRAPVVNARHFADFIFWAERAMNKVQCMYWTSSCCTKRLKVKERYLFLQFACAFCKALITARVALMKSLLNAYFLNLWSKSQGVLSVFIPWCARACYLKDLILYSFTKAFVSYEIILQMLRARNYIWCVTFIIIIKYCYFIPR
jgi:hypothetical protein